MAKTALKLWDEKFEKRAWIKWINKPQIEDLCKLTITGMSDGVTAAAFSPNGQFLVCASRDCVLKVFEVSTGRELGSLKGHSGPIVDCCFSYDNRLVASAGWDSVAKIWDISTFSELATLKGHRERLSGVVFTQDSSKVITSGWDSYLILWNVVDGSKIFELRGHSKPVNSLSLAPNGIQLASGITVHHLILTTYSFLGWRGENMGHRKP